MRYYIYQADHYCEACGDAICEHLREAGQAPEDTFDESSYDSDEYPKGPYRDGETDCPAHCGECGDYLAISLTSEGVEYVLAALVDAIRSGSASDAMHSWAFDLEYYGLEPKQQSILWAFKRKFKQVSC